ncbi:hypothetical protein OGATHE_005595 [Ogataea polymorpha]|uniref:Uncharacterized protein n=1 Tax=Ogataea polymorpha TaxID=460523 RepID=A0A9P8NTP7_9ASCO|nr:hypothetical protein OGATHE_005595 [Ogataea polymorpha]
MSSDSGTLMLSEVVDEVNTSVSRDDADRYREPDSDWSIEIIGTESVTWTSKFLDLITSIPLMAFSTTSPTLVHSFSVIAFTLPLIWMMLEAQLAMKMLCCMSPSMVMMSDSFSKLATIHLLSTSSFFGGFFSLGDFSLRLAGFFGGTGTVFLAGTADDARSSGFL